MPGARRPPRAAEQETLRASAPKFGLAALLALAVLGTAACGGPSSTEAPPEATPEPETASGTASGSPDPAPRPQPPEPSPSPEGPAYSTWELGARPLPLRADGLGEIRPTPPSLRTRRYPTIDLLPPPRGDRFVASSGPVTSEVRRRMGMTWRPGCPVPLAGLRYVQVSFRGFDGAAHTGELVLAEAEAADVISVFRALYRVDFPIEEMRLPTTADLEARPTGDGNDTAALVCRATTGGSSLSAHAYGLAIDLNPFQNPYQRDDVVLPELASSYLDRAWRRPGMVYADSLAVREFARIGWSWGGDFSSLKDYQHFSATGR